MFCHRASVVCTFSFIGLVCNPYLLQLFLSSITYWTFIGVGFNFMQFIGNVFYQPYLLIVIELGNNSTILNGLIFVEINVPYYQSPAVPQYRLS